MNSQEYEQMTAYHNMDCIYDNVPRRERMKQIGVDVEGWDKE